MPVIQLLGGGSLQAPFITAVDVYPSAFAGAKTFDTRNVASDEMLLLFAMGPGNASINGDAAIPGFIANVKQAYYTRGPKTNYSITGFTSQGAGMAGVVMTVKSSNGSTPDIAIGCRGEVVTTDSGQTYAGVLSSSANTVATNRVVYVETAPAATVTFSQYGNALFGSGIEPLYYQWHTWERRFAANINPDTSSPPQTTPLAVELMYQCWDVRVKDS